jgi:hypothetical protein
MTRSLARVGAILLLLLLISTPIAAQVNGTTATNDAANPTQECGFKGNSDMYGLGIRLGIYTQGELSTPRPNPPESSNITNVSKALRQQYPAHTVKNRQRALLSQTAFTKYRPPRACNSLSGLTLLASSQCSSLSHTRLLRMTHLK